MPLNPRYGAEGGLMTVVEKIHQLSDALLCSCGARLTPAEEVRKAKLQEQLQVIRTSCPESWAKAAIR